MPIFKCKMCGGQLSVTEGATIIECEYCGSTQTLPSFDNEKKSNLFNRANNLRLNKEFDKAAGVYESIVAEFPDEAEAYWGLCLCKYGIEYVDDQKTGRKIPTCHRTCTTSIMDDTDYASVIKNASALSRKVYEEEAEAIDVIQKQILEIVSNEAPYDVFICYKETDDATHTRTEDSAIAQDIYTELIKEGYKVFFSRVTLRDHAGAEYEPYIYAALSSAKVMLVIGTKAEYYDAVWVKNEWARYLAMMNYSQGKLLIPCYKNMDAYDMPKEFKGCQALNISNVTFYKDLQKNIEKYVHKNSCFSARMEDYVQQQTVQYDDKFLISKVMSIGTSDSKDYWPKGSYNAVIDKTKFAVLMFHIYMQKPFGVTKTIKLHFTVYDEFLNTITNNTIEISVETTYDRLAQAFILRGTDGTQISDGAYTAKFSVENSRPVEYSFRLISGVAENNVGGHSDNPGNNPYDLYEYALKLKKIGFSEKNAEKLDKAIEVFKQIPGYKDSEEQLSDIYYRRACSVMKQDPQKAIELFKNVLGYKNTTILIQQCEELAIWKAKYDNLTADEKKATKELEDEKGHYEHSVSERARCKKWRAIFAVLGIVSLLVTAVIIFTNSTSVAYMISIAWVVLSILGVYVRTFVCDKSFIVSCILFFFMIPIVPITTTREISFYNWAIENYKQKIVFQTENAKKLSEQRDAAGKELERIYSKMI